MEIHSDSLLSLLTSFILLCNYPGSLGNIVVCNGPYYNYTTGSTFNFNLQQLRAGLPLNDYFYNATYGEAPDQVYGLTMCYADVSSKACNNCLFEALTGIAKECALMKNQLAWYDACMIRISDAVINTSNNIVGSECKPKVPDSKHEILAEPEKFRDILQQLFDGLATNASSSPLRLAAGKINYTSRASIYALAQCTRQTPTDECRMCIGNLTEFGVESCAVRDSTVSVDETFKTNCCYARFALKPFYVISEAHPPWKNSSKSSREPISTCMFTIIISCLLVLLAGILL